MKKGMSWLTGRREGWKKREKKETGRGRLGLGLCSRSREPSQTSSAGSIGRKVVVVSWDSSVGETEGGPSRINLERNPLLEFLRNYSSFLRTAAVRRLRRRFSQFSKQ